MIKVVITTPEIKELKGTAKATGNPYHLRIQTAHAFTVDKDTGAIVEFPDKFEISLDKEQTPYARGTYQLAPSALYVGREGRLEVRPRLVPLAAGKA
jgi:Helix-destabilising protein